MATRVEIEGLEIRRPMVIAAGDDAAIEIGLAAEDGQFPRRRGRWRPGRAAALRRGPRGASCRRASRPQACAVVALRSRLARRIDGDAIYRRFTVRGLAYGPSLQGIAEIWAGDDEALGRIVAPASVKAELG